MCGIAGFWGAVPMGGAADIGLCMADALRHRGPDDHGVWVGGDSIGAVVLAHRRLSIIDTSSAGHQPMLSASGRFILAYNGETYNHLDLRAALPAIPWKGRSDTETILAALEAWGIETTLQRQVGMFAMAIWDRERQQLTLARDRVGEKPLYYGVHRGTLLFGSELKALTAHPAWAGEMDLDALALYMRYGYVPQPMSIWKGISKLLPGTSVTVWGNAAALEIGEPVAYWRASDVFANATRIPADENEAADELERLLRQAISGQMLADVPLGAFLSGGIDSSTIVALMQALSSQPVRTFSIGFNESDYNEAEYAKAVARHLGTNHTELYVAPKEAREVIPAIPGMFDEPFGDSSQIPTYLVAKMARQHVTVCLSGDGGDELFGGYNRYSWGRSIWKHVGPVPRGVRALAGKAIGRVPTPVWDRLGRLLPAGLRQPAFGDRLQKLISVIDVADPTELYHRLICQQRESQSIVIGAADRPTWAVSEWRRLIETMATDFTDGMMFSDLVGYLPDDILTKVDRSAMAVSLETRIPFLDHRLIEFAWSLPLEMKIRGREGKWLVRQVLSRYVPTTLTDRPKQGFGIPLDSWLRGPLREWAEDLLDEGKLRRAGVLRAAPIRRRWQEHLSGRRNWQHWLWNVLIYQQWTDDLACGDGRSSPISLTCAMAPPNRTGQESQSQ